MAIVRESKVNVSGTMDSKKNEHFPSVSDATKEKLATKYIPEITKKMTKWAVTTFWVWRDVHNAQRTSGKCPNDLLEKCEAGALNKWLTAELSYICRWLSSSPQDSWQDCSNVFA